MGEGNGFRYHRFSPLGRSDTLQQFSQNALVQRDDRLGLDCGAFSCDNTGYGCRPGRPITTATRG